MTACEALNLVRKRSVKTLIPTGLDRVAFQKVLEREKRVEFAFENQPFLGYPPLEDRQIYTNRNRRSQDYQIG